MITGAGRLRRARTDSGASGVVILTVHDDEQYLQRALGAGVRGYLLELISGRELTAAMQRVCAGETVIHPALASQVHSTNSGTRAGKYWPAVRRGRDRWTHMRAVYRKLDVTDRTAAVATALREGLFQ